MHNCGCCDASCGGITKGTGGTHPRKESINGWSEDSRGCHGSSLDSRKLLRVETFHGASTWSSGGTTGAERLKGLDIVAVGRDGWHSSIGCGQVDCDIDTVPVATRSDVGTKGRISFKAARSTEAE